MKRAVFLAPAVALALGGCTALPKDVSGTLEDVSGGTLIVGVTEHHPYIDVHDDGSVTGTDADLVQGYADSIDANVEWIIGNEEQLAEQISQDELHIVAGGLTKKNSWSSKFSPTRTYGDNRVMGVPMGENAFQVSLERYLAEQGGELK